MKHLLVLAVSLSTAACTNEFLDEAEPLEGIYHLGSRTLNIEACVPGTLPSAGTQQFAVATADQGYGYGQLELMSCASLDDCRTKKQRWLGGEVIEIDFIYSVNDVGSGDMLVRDETNAGFPIDGQCVNGSKSRTELTVRDGALRLEVRQTFADTYPQGCTEKKALAAMKGNECTWFELMTATKVE